MDCFWQGSTHVCPDQMQDVLVARAVVVLAVPRQHGMQQLVAVVLQATHATPFEAWQGHQHVLIAKVMISDATGGLAKWSYSLQVLFVLGLWQQPMLMQEPCGSVPDLWGGGRTLYRRRMHMWFQWRASCSVTDVPRG